jgi:hypothetical protein
MSDHKFVSVLGKYFGEVELTLFLAELNILKLPKIPRDESDIIVEVKDHGIELTFQNEDSLDVSFREYPDGAVVLSNIFFHGVETKNHGMFRLDLPFNLSYSMNKEDAAKALGSEPWVNKSGNLLRWDFGKYCISTQFDDGGRMELVGVQLPNRFTMKSK